MAILTIDPGTNTGWCFFRLASPRPNVMATGSINGAQHGKTWEARAQGVVQEFRHLLERLSPAQVWLEQPEAFASTSTQSGSQFKLDAVFGMLVGVCIVYKTPWFMVRVRDWKGQLPKAVSTQRTISAMGMVNRKAPLPAWYPRNEHSWDAVGLAVHVNKLRGKSGRDLR